MARVILENGGEDVTVGGSDVDVIGTSTGGEIITITGGNVTLDASFANGGDTIVMEGEAEDYTAEIVGSRLVLTSGTTTVSIPLGTESNAIVFGGDDTRELMIGENGEVMLGGQEIDQDGETTLEPGDDDGDIISALAALQAAEQAITDFEEEQEMTSQEIRDEAAATEEALADAREIDTDAQLRADLTAADADVDAAEEDVAAVDGLDEAIEELEAANTEAEAALENWNEAQAELVGQQAEYQALTGTAPDLNGLDYVDGEFSGEVIGAGGVVIIEADEDGNLVVGEDVEEEEMEVVMDLLDSINGIVEAQERAMTAFEAQAAAQEEVDLLDQVASADDERDNIEDFNEAVEDYEEDLAAYQEDADAGTEAALEASYDVLLALGLVDVTTDTDADGEIDADEIVAAEDDIVDAIEDRQDALDAALLAAESDNPRQAELEAALDAQADAEEAVADRDELIADADAAADLLDQLEDLGPTEVADLDGAHAVNLGPGRQTAHSPPSQHGWM